MGIKRIPSILTQAMRKQYPGKITETPFMKILGRLRGASRNLPIGTKVLSVVVVGGSIMGQWVGIDLMTEELVIGRQDRKDYCMLEVADSLRIVVNMKELIGKELQKAKDEIIQTLEIARKNPGAGGIESFYQDHGDPPFSPFDGLSCNKEVVREELGELLNILKREIERR